MNNAMRRLMLPLGACAAAALVASCGRRTPTAAPRYPLPLRADAIELRVGSAEEPQLVVAEGSPDLNAWREALACLALQEPQGPAGQATGFKFSGTLTIRSTDGTALSFLIVSGTPLCLYRRDAGLLVESCRDMPSDGLTALYAERRSGPGVAADRPDR